MAERIGPTVIMLSVFVAMSALLVATLGQVFYYNVRSVEAPEGFDYDGGPLGTEYIVDWWHPTATEGGHTVTEGNITSLGRQLTKTALSTGADPGAMRFWKEGTNAESAGDRNAVKVWVVRNNTDYLIGSDMAYKDVDYLMVGQNVGNWWGSKWRRATISFTEILLHENDNVSAVQLDLGWRNFTLFVQTSSGSGNFTNHLWNNSFTVYLGQQIGNEIAGSQSVWSIIGKLLSFQLVDVNTPNSELINFLISFPIWIAIAFIVMTLLSRFLPFVSGG